MADFAIGVDLGGTNLRIAAIDVDGYLIEKVTLETRVSEGPDRVLDHMCEAILRLAEKHQNQSRMLGIGVGVLGIIDAETGMMRDSPNFPGWENSPVQSAIEKRLGTRVIVENDANCAAFGENWLGAARGVKDMAILTLGTGLGGGIVLNGRIWSGMTGMAGEFGHMTLEPNGIMCGCGNRGCAEQYASASAVMRMTKEAVAGGHAPALENAARSDPNFSAKSVYNLAVEGDEPARRIYQNLGRALGILIGNLVNALNLPMYVVGGGVSSAWDVFAPSMFEALCDRSMVYVATLPVSQGDDPGSTNSANKKRRTTVVTRALLGSDAGLFGAARLPMVEKLAAGSC